MIGGGQEIHDGEAGLEEWGRAIVESRTPWQVLVSPEVITGGTSVAGHRLFADSKPDNMSIIEESAMHLGVSVRTPRAQHLAEWVNAVLTTDSHGARDLIGGMEGYRIALTRDLGAARKWLATVSTGEVRAGLIARSGSLRHRAYGLELDPEFHRGYPIEVSVL
jgi:hypothetical protein